jgi:hypothetical protein
MIRSLNALIDKLDQNEDKTRNSLSIILAYSRLINFIFNDDYYNTLEDAKKSFWEDVNLFKSHPYYIRMYIPNNLKE